MTGDADRDPVDVLVEQFLLRHRRGEPITVAGFAAQHEPHGDALRELLPTLLALESVKRERACSSSGSGRLALPALDRLGDFRIVRELGRGGMGVVFEAVQESLDRHVALKVLPQAALLQGHQLERFLREAQVAARLHHTHIVPVYGSGESDGYHWYAMQFIDGESLERWRQRQERQLPAGSGAWRNRARFVARLGRDAASALAFAHSVGTLHRDIKPANLLLDRHDHLWITDFGLAKALENEGLTNSGDLLGTLQYMAPEQFTGRYDERSEVYALGATLYELLACRPVFQGRNRSELMERVRSQRPEALQRIAPDLPADLVVVVEKAMARDPADRYASAAALHADLEAFLEDRAIAARRLSPLANVWRWCRRNRGMASLAGATLLALLAALVTGWAAYGITGDALARAERESAQVEINLRLTLAAFGDMFDSIVARDSLLAVQDAGDGEGNDAVGETVWVRAAVGPEDVALLQRMLQFYEEFAAQNAASQSLRYDTARAYRRVGEIHLRLGQAKDLKAAEQAFQRAEVGLSLPIARDVAREQALLAVDRGRLALRVGQGAVAVACFEEALQRWQSLAGRDPSGVKLEQAEVHFELARVHGGLPGGPTRRREHLREAFTMLQEVLAASPEEPRARILQARCQLDAARSLRRRGLERGDFADPDELIAAAIAALRQLAAEFPQRTEFRFELAQAMLDAQRGPGRARGPRDGSGGGAGSGNASGGGTASELAVLREAEATAAQLFAEQPWFVEYRALLGRTRSSLAMLLAAPASGGADGERLPLAIGMLRDALAVELPLLGAAADDDPRFVRQVAETRRGLARLSLQVGDRAAAREQAAALLDLAERQLQAGRASGDPRAAGGGEDPDGPPGPPRDRSGGRGGPPEGPPGRARAGILPMAHELTRRLGDAELLQRVDDLLQRYPPPRPR